MSAPTLTRHEKQAETRAALLRSAGKLFRRDGLEGTSVEDVARDAGYTKGAFYSNFESKEALFLVMLEEKFTAELERLDRALAGGDDPTGEARDAAADFLGFIRSDPEWPRLYFEFAAYAARDETFRLELAKRQRALRERMAALFERFADEVGVRPPMPFADVATMAFAMADGFLLDRMVDPEIGDDVYETMTAIFFRGMQATALGWDPQSAPRR